MMKNGVTSHTKTKARFAALHEPTAALDRGLKWRMWWITCVVLLMVGSGILSQWGDGEWWGVLGSTLVNACWIIGVPMLGWHGSVPFAGRVLIPLGMLSGVNLKGAFALDYLWMIGDVPVIFFLTGWVVDWCLSGSLKRRNFAGRSVVTLLEIWTAYGSLVRDATVASYLWCLMVIVGIVLLWLPRERALPKSQRFTNDSLLSPMRKGAAWIMTRIAMALFVFLPSVLYLDLIDLPENLQSATYEENAKPFYWLREGRPLTAEDLTKREIYVAEPMTEAAWKEAIGPFRQQPADPILLNRVRELGKPWTGSMVEFSQLTVNPLATVFYVEPNATKDGRASAGILSAGVYPPELAALSELRVMDAPAVQEITANMHMALWVVLANSIIILLILSSPAGGSAAAWWLVVLLAGANMGWTQNSLPFIVERIYYMIWSRFGNEPVGGFLTALYALLTGLGYVSAWVNKMGITIAGLWVALCWPHRPQRLIQSSADRFWSQLPKVLLVVTAIWIGRFSVTYTQISLDAKDTPWFLYWLFAEPILLFSAGYFIRKRSGLSRRLPLLGVLAAGALLLRQETVQIWNAERYFMPEVGGWVGWLAVCIYIAQGLMIIIALERGKFLAPPHLQGQVWLVGVAAIPFVANIIGDPVASAIDGSGFFLGTSAGWLAFAAAVWCLDPIFSWISEKLSSFRVQGLEGIEVARAKLLECCHAAVPPVRVRREVGKVIRRLGLKQCQGWQRCGQTLCRVYAQDKRSAKTVCVMMPEVLADRLAGYGGALRLEEAKLEWKWAAFETNLLEMEAALGDVLLLPVSHDGILLGMLSVPDLPENRVLLRPVVGQQLASLLAVSHFLLPDQPTEGELVASV